MVFPAHELIIKVGTKGRTSTAPGDMVTVADMETVDIAIDDGVEEWTPYDQEGYVRRLKTAKSVTVSISGKRNKGDAGNDYIAGLMTANGEAANTVISLEFPDGAKWTIPSVCNVTSNGGGASTDVSPLAADFMSDGKPTYTPAA